MAKKKRRGSSKAGRPKVKDRSRYPSGKLKPVGPNERVLVERRRMLGSEDLDLSLASNPLDLAFARRWMTTRRYRAGRLMAGLARRAGILAPRMGASGPEEAEASQAEPQGRQGDWRYVRGPLGGMTRAEIAAAWDGAFNRPSAEDIIKAQEQAMAQWKAVRAAMTPEEVREVDRLCIDEVWPPWITMRIDEPERELLPAVKRRKRILESGLDKVAETLWPRAAAPTAIAVSGPAEPRPSGPLREETTIYVTPEGEQVLEVVRRTRRAASA